METISSSFAWVSDITVQNFWSFISKPFQAGDRFYWLYVVSTLVIALFIYRLSARFSENAPKSFLSFLFPRSVWEKKSAWLDLRFFVVNHFTGKLLYARLTGIAMAATYSWVTGGESLLDAVRGSEIPTFSEAMASVMFLIIVSGFTSFTTYYLHYLQHKVPFLWEFHKVHRSAEVMHPVSNFREHPFDNVAYTLGVGAVTGPVVGMVYRTIGYLPYMPLFLGIPLLTFLFNFGGYHLRHSHIWLRWPGKWSMIFPSPAHHHVHHSCHPDHLDKNFAFMFPLWDVIFKTYHMPEDDRDVKFGLFGVEEDEYTSIWKLYTLPFRNIYRKWSKGQRLTIGEEPREADTSREPDIAKT